MFCAKGHRPPRHLRGADRKRRAALAQLPCLSESGAEIVALVPLHRVRTPGLAGKACRRIRLRFGCDVLAEWTGAEVWSRLDDAVVLGDRGCDHETYRRLVRALRESRWSRRAASNRGLHSEPNAGLPSAPSTVPLVVPPADPLREPRRHPRSSRTLGRDAHSAAEMPGSFTGLLQNGHDQVTVVPVDVGYCPSRSLSTEAMPPPCSVRWAFASRAATGAVGEHKVRRLCPAQQEVSRAAAGAVRESAPVGDRGRGGRVRRSCASRW